MSYLAWSPGLGALLAASEFWFSVVKWVGVLYLAYLGVRLLRSKGTLAVPADGSSFQSSSKRTIFLRSLLVAVTNPKGYLFFSAFLPQFIVPTDPQLPQYAALAVTFAAIDFVVMFAYAFAGVAFGSTQTLGIAGPASKSAHGVVALASECV